MTTTTDLDRYDRRYLRDLIADRLRDTESGLISGDPADADYLRELLTKLSK